EQEIIVEALDKSFRLEEFSLDKVDEHLFDWEKGGITDPIGQLAGWIVDTLSGAISDLASDVWNWLTTIRDGIVNAISSVITSVQDALSSAISAVGSVVDTILASLDSFISYVEGAFASVQEAISSIGATISGIVNAVQSAISDFAASISGYIDTLRAWLSDAISNITQGLSAIATQIISAVETIPTALEGAIATLKEWFRDAFTTVATTLSQFGTTLSSFATRVLDTFEEFGASLYEFITTIRDAITQAYGKFRAWVGERIEQIWQGLKDVGMALSGFINPIVEIKNWIYEKLAGIGEFFQSTIEFFAGIKDKAITFFERVGSFFVDMPRFFEEAKDRLIAVGHTIWEAMIGIGQKVWSGVEKFGSWIKDLFIGVVTKLTNAMLSTVETGISSPLSVISKRIKRLPAGVGEIDILSHIAMGYSIEAAKQMAAVTAMEAAGDAIGDQEVSAEPIGLGTKIKLKLGSFLKNAAKFLKEVVLDTLKISFFGMAFWTVEPVKFYTRKALRNILPVELPTIHDMIEYTRRRMPTRVFTNWLEKSREIMEYRGYNDVFIDATFTSIDELPPELQIKIKDRFGVDRLLPTSAVYDLPTSSDFCRMMVRDIIKLDGFKKAMLARGMIPDIAKMYYLLHFRYPPLEKLYEFVCRCAAGFAWVDAEPEKEEDLGVRGVKPTTLNVISSDLGKTFNLGEVTNKIGEYVKKYLIHYAKWHDYAPFAYVQGFTADRLINLDMMADVPMRIDGRWMYKWGIINEYDVFRIATARGMHPRWLEPITVAECMNALAEERTLARTGVMNVFKEGFATEKEIREALSKLTTVKILGKERVVKFLEGERKLLTLRAKYDRALDILRDYHRDLVKAYEENVVEWGDVTGALKKTADALAKGLSIKLTLDGKYYELYEAVAESLKSVYTIRRIRYWLRYMMRTLLTRFERGYISEDEMKKIVNEIKEFASLTDEERDAILEVAEMLLTVFNREMVARGILRKLSRGVITTEEAKKKLKGLGLNDEVIEGLIEYHAKTYTLTLDRLISYQEYVPIPKNMLERKIDTLGVPEDEAKLIPAYAFARVVSSEVGRVATELVSDYAEGLMTENELKKALDDLATMGGKVKRELGVDWIVLSPEEREYLIYLAKLRRARKEAGRRRRGS
ncbi:hypothetical protein DRN97_07585, partial [Methanosarcinales archaeon]